jgi:hypothetical protein
MSTMTEWQQTAFAHPCRLAEETAHPRFQHRTALGSVVLTINYGYE